MRVIYNNARIEGLEGIYKNPLYFKELDPFATEVFTDDEAIAKAYEERGVKVFKLDGSSWTEKPRRTRKTSKKSEDKGE